MDYFIAVFTLPAILAIAGIIGGIVCIVNWKKRKKGGLLAAGIVSFVVTAVCVLYIAGYLLVYLIGAALFGDSSRPHENIDGVITGDSEAYDYTGWWLVSSTEGSAPFMFIEVSEDDWVTVYCYTESGDFVDLGFVDYNEQRALNGKDLIVFVFEDIGEYGAQPYGTEGGGKYMSLTDYSGFNGDLVYLEEQPFFN